MRKGQGEPRKKAAKPSDPDAIAPELSIDWSLMPHVDESSLTELVRACLAAPCDPDQDSRKTWAQFLVERLVNRAAGGDMPAFRELWMRAEGRPGHAGPAPESTVTIDDELARMILEYERRETITAADAVRGHEGRGDTRPHAQK